MSLEKLKKEALQIVDSVSNFPEKRYELREAFYKEYGHEVFSKEGLGNSELAFLEWEIKRGVLNPIEDKEKKGSPWWRAVNSEFIYFSTLAELIYQSGQAYQNLEVPVTNWLKYLENATAQTWYKAHNSSIITGYINNKDLAYQENHYEQLFMNIVLYRLLYAQSLVEGVTLGELGEFLANPRFPAVDIITDIQALYPDNYPLTKQDIINITHMGHNLGDIVADILDEMMIIPELDRLYHEAAKWNKTPGVIQLEKNGTPAYPVLMKLSITQKIINAIVKFIEKIIHLIFGKKKILNEA